MSAEGSTAPQAKSPRPKRRRTPPPRIVRLALKELRETLRDRRTIATLLLMPILVYPLLSVAFERFLMSNMKTVPEHSDYVLGLRTQSEADKLGRYIYRGLTLLNEREKTRRHMTLERRPKM